MTTKELRALLAAGTAGECLRTVAPMLLDVVEAAEAYTQARDYVSRVELERQLRAKLEAFHAAR